MLADDKRYKQDNDSFFKVAKSLLSREFGFARPSESDSWRLALLGFSSKATTYENCPRMHDVLEPSDFSLLWKTFNNNNKCLFDTFVSSPFIRKLWPKAISEMKFSDCFSKGVNQSMTKTYEAIAKDIKRAGLAVPNFWPHE